MWYAVDLFGLTKNQLPKTNLRIRLLHARNLFGGRLQHRVKESSNVQFGFETIIFEEKNYRQRTSDAYSYIGKTIYRN